MADEKSESESGNRGNKESHENQRNEKEETRRTISPYDLTAADNPGAVISYPLLRGTNYEEWALSFETALCSRKKFGFLDGSITQPPRGSRDYDDWKPVNALIVSWIKMSIHESIRSSIGHRGIAKDLWDSLKKRYSLASGPRLQQLTVELALCRQDNQTIEQYYVKERRVSEYYKKQERLLEGFNEMESMHEPGFVSGAPSEEEIKKLAKSERLAVHISNGANLILFIAKVYASIESRSTAVIASTLESLLDLLSGFILWYTAKSMRKPNHFRYPIGKRRMRPVGIIVFACVMMTSLGVEVLLESGRQLVSKSGIHMNNTEEKWMIGIIFSVIIVKFLLMLYCRRFKNEIVRTYAQDHLFDVITNFIGVATAVLALKFYWWFDPSGAIVIALYTIATWGRTVLKNVHSLIGRSAPPEFLTKLTFLIWNHHEQIKHIDTVRAYTLGSHYFVEVDIVLPEDMRLQEAHDIGKTLQEKLEQLDEVERAFVRF